LYYHHKTQKGEKTRILEYSLSTGGPKTKNKKNPKKEKKKKKEKLLFYKTIYKSPTFSNQDLF
jgi:hypothetical protein